MSAENQGAKPEQLGESIPNELISVEETHIPESDPVAVDQPQTINPKLQTQEMEVHHPGHPASGGKKRNGKSMCSSFSCYSLRFFVVF